MQLNKIKIIIFQLVFLFICSCDSFNHKQKIYKVGVSPDYPPFEFRENNKLKGFDVDLINEIANRSDFSIEFIEMDFSSLVPAVKAQKIDMAISGFTKTIDRAKQVAFSAPYYATSVAILYNKNYGELSVKDLNNKIFGVQLGSTLEISAKNFKNQFKDINIVSLNSNLSLVQQLKLGRIQVVIIEEAQAKNFIQKNKELSYFLIPESGDNYHIILHKNSPIIEDINKIIKELKQDNFINSLKNTWLNESDNSEDILIASIKFIPLGVFITLKYAIISVFLGFVIGVFLAVSKISEIAFLKYFASFYTSIFRGTPLLVQLSLIYFALPEITGIDLSVFAAGVLAFSLNSGAYVSEIIRAGILSIDKGQIEAARSLAIPYNKTIKDIILPQAIRNILPSLVNEMINLLKESAIISVIGEADLMRRAQIIAAEKYSYIEPIIIAAICYYILVLIMTFFAKKIENRLKI